MKKKYECAQNRNHHHLIHGDKVRIKRNKLIINCVICCRNRIRHDTTEAVQKGKFEISAHCHSKSYQREIVTQFLVLVFMCEQKHFHMENI